MQHLFLADVHLGAFTGEKDRQLENEVISIIDYCSEYSIKLYLLGDLFDYWMEYPDHKPDLGSDLLSRFREFNESGNAVTYITGNHDNWTTGYFEKLGFTVEADYKSITLDGQKVLLHHGDGISETFFNLPRPLFHRLLRNDLFIKIYQHIFPPEAGLDLMKKFSSMSKENPEIKPERLNEWAEKFLSNTDYDITICGHDHIPRVETFPFGTYINTGAFFSTRTLVLYNNGLFELVAWNDEERHLYPYIDQVSE